MQDDAFLPYPRKSQMILRVAGLGFFLLLCWAYWAQIDQVTRTSGQVIASGRTQVVQSPDGGVMNRLLVKEGDRVEKGQLLAVLERGRVQAAVNDVSAKVAALEITIARLNAEIYGHPMDLPHALVRYKDYFENQKKLYTQRQRALTEELQALENSLNLSKEELDMNQPLLKTGDVSRADILRLQRQISDIQAQITNRRNKYLQDAQLEMTKVQEELKTQTEVLSDRTQLLGHTELQSPSTGIVKNIRMSTVGGVLRAGEELMQIVPTESNLVVEVKLRPMDVGFIEVGLPVTLKLDAYDYTIFGSMRGTVSYISADTLSEETRQGEQTFYRVQIRIADQEDFKGNRSQHIDVRPGLTVIAEIKTGTRSVLSYLTKPIIKTFGQALGER